MKLYTILGGISLSLVLHLSSCQSGNLNKSAKDFTTVGFAKMAGGDYKGAIDAFDGALRLDPNNPNILMSRGLARAEMGQLLMAIDDYSLALTENPNLHKALIYRGNANNQLLQRDEALADFSQAIALQPQNAIAFTNRALTYYSLGPSERRHCRPKGRQEHLSGNPRAPQTERSR